MQGMPAQSSSAAPHAHPVVDVHAHVVPPTVLPRLREDATRHGVRLERTGDQERVVMGPFTSRPFLPFLSYVKERLETMDRQGVDIQLLSGWVELFGYDLPAEDGTRFARMQNEAMAELVREHPDRFIGLATAPLQDGDAAARVLEEAVRDFKLPGAQIGTNVAGRNLDDASLEPFWGAAEETGALVLIHPLQSQVAGGERLRSYYFENLLGNPFETTIAAASLLFGGVLERHPRLKVCLAHGGGFLPYQLGRLAKGYNERAEARERLKEGPRSSFERLFLDTILHDQDNLQRLLEMVGADRLLLGSDYPFDMGEDDPVGKVRGLRGLSEEERARILGGNALRLLPH